MKVDYLKEHLTIEKFIKFLNFSKIYFPYVKEAFDEDDEKSHDSSFYTNGDDLPNTGF